MTSPTSVAFAVHLSKIIFLGLIYWKKYFWENFLFLISITIHIRRKFCELSSIREKIPSIDCEQWESMRRVRKMGCFNGREGGKSFSYNKLTYSINIDGVSRCPLNVCSYKANMNHYDTTTVFYSQSRSLYLLTLFINCFDAVFARTSSSIRFQWCTKFFNASFLKQILSEIS